MPEVLDPPTCLYATVKMVRIDAISDTQLTFSSRSSADNYESFTVPLDYDTILTDPPTDSPTPVPLSVGSIGYLYLSKTGWQTQAASGATLYQAGSGYVLFKYPICRPYRLLANLRVKPKSIVVEGTNLATGAPITIDLLGDDCVEAQDVDWRAAAPITVQLTAAGAAAYGGQNVLLVWPRKITLTGASLKKPHITTSLDVLDVFNGDFIQHLVWSSKGAPVDLRLSSAGFGKFKVSPPQVEYLAKNLRVTYPEDLLRELDALKDVDEEDVREHLRLARKHVKARLKKTNKSAPKTKPKQKPKKRS